MSSTPKAEELRKEASALRDQARRLFETARDAGSAPDKEKIVSKTRRAKELDQLAAKLEDESHVLSPEVEMSQSRIEILIEQSHISQIEENLFLSGYHALEDDSTLDNRGITHILSVCQYYLPSTAQQSKYNCKTIPVLDTADQNLLQYLNECNTFIEGAVKGGKILIHCHAGQSRSTTVLAAYLMQRDKLGVRAVLDRIRAVRRVEPNDNFMNQLRIYRDCEYQVSEEHALYRRWKFDQLHKSLPALDAPVRGTTQYQDNDTSSKYTSIRCKKCRFVLASENHIILHEPKIATELPESQQSSLIPSSCAHFFLEPIRWMKSELEKGELDGRFVCPNAKCGAKIGSYAWQGMTCSCRRWVLPALCIQRSKVDEMKSKTPAKVEPARKQQPSKIK